MGRQSAVEEAEKIFLTKRLSAFYESDEPYLELPPSLSTNARAFCHALCTKYGLFSKSKGTGDARFLTISKAVSDAALHTPKLDLKPQQRDVLVTVPDLPFETLAAVRLAWSKGDTKDAEYVILFDLCVDVQIATLSIAGFLALGDISTLRSPQTSPQLSVCITACS
jgi:hypothetical protein